MEHNKNFATNRVLPTLDYFEQYARKYSHLIDASDTVVEFVVAFLERALIKGSSHLYNDPYLLLQLVSGAQGACFMHPEDFSEKDLEGLAGQSVLEAINFVKPHIKVALLDAYYYLLNQYQDIQPNEVIEFNGLTSHKSIARAEYIVDKSRTKPGDNLLIIGVIDDIVRVYLDKQVNLKLADFARVDTMVCGINIELSGLPYIQWADKLLVTGNTLKTDTLWSILPEASKQNKHIIVYAMTGANIAPRYLDWGANVVTTESFPYYWYANTSSQMKVYMSI